MGYALTLPSAGDGVAEHAEDDPDNEQADARLLVRDGLTDAALALCLDATNASSVLLGGGLDPLGLEVALGGARG